MPERYSHRNGESEPPVEPGVYWFEGVFYYEGEDELSTYYRIYVVTPIGNEDAKLWAYKFMDDNPHERGKRVDMLTGRWWGPVLPPWEQDA